jgi:WXG100 family type VII secretion target
MFTSLWIGVCTLQMTEILSRRTEAINRLACAVEGVRRMADIKVTPEELHDIARQLESGSADIETRLAHLHSLVSGLVTAHWQGAASNNFDELYTGWHHAATQLRQSLDGISRILGSAATTYEQTEQQLARQLHG